MQERSRTNRLRLTASLVAMVVAMTACSAVDDAVDGLSDAASDAVEAIGDVASDIASPSATEEPGAVDSDGDGEPDATTAPPSGDGQPPADSGGLAAPVNDAGNVGFHGPAMLRGSVSRLILEVDSQAGATVDQGAISALVDRMRQIVDKPGGVEFVGGNGFQSDREEWTTADLRSAAAENRNNYSSADTVVVYALFVKGGLFSGGQETNAIGVAYNASEFAIFSDKIDGTGGLLGSDTAVYRAVLIHEWGHLLGLVNIGYTSEIDHEDPDNPGHSRNRDSVMYFAIDSTLVTQLFSGPPPDQFDDADLADLEGIRSGKYRG